VQRNERQANKVALKTKDLLNGDKIARQSNLIAKKADPRYWRRRTRPLNPFVFNNVHVGQLYILGTCDVTEKGYPRHLAGGGRPGRTFCGYTHTLIGYDDFGLLE